MRVTADSVLALRDKYREIKRLRDEHAAGRGGDPRSAMAALGRRFPGALRELDELPMDEIERRLSALEALVEAAATQVPEWVQLQIGYHGCMRAVLRIKRMAAGPAEGRAEAILAELLSGYVPAADEPPLASFDRAAIEAILKPHGGRLNPWVYRWVGSRCGVEPERVQRALFLR